MICDDDDDDDDVDDARPVYIVGSGMMHMRVVQRLVCDDL